MSLHDTFKYLMDAYRATSICVPTERIVSGVTGRRTDRFLGKQPMDAYALQIGSELQLSSAMLFRLLSF